MKKFLYLSCIYLPLLVAKSDSVEDNMLSAAHATYEDTTLQLTGDVKVEHGLGLLQAQKAHLYKDENSRAFPFSQIHLEDSVYIVCKNDTSLQCDIADLDFISLQGTLSSTTSSPVFYTYEDKEEPSRSKVELQSQEITLQLTRQTKENHKEEYFCSQALAKHNVIAKYAQDFAIQTDSILYSNSSSSAPSQGMLSTEKGQKALIFYKDVPIKASFVEVSLPESQLHLASPKGALPMNLFSTKTEEHITFACDDIRWNYAAGHLQMQGNICIEGENFGSLVAEDKVLFTQDVSTGSLDSLQVQGKSTLSHQEAHLTCYENLLVDNRTRQITASSSGQPILYVDAHICLQADKALLEYTELEYELSSLTFQGNVRINSSDSQKEARFALADRLTYAPETKTFLLSAFKGKRVLFYDEESGAIISAKEVLITENGQTGKPDIKGIGNVQFSLSAEEKLEMKKHFPSITF